VGEQEHRKVALVREKYDEHLDTGCEELEGLANKERCYV
jgi:hypothetical protein